jgi:hypothetical protein
MGDYAKDIVLDVVQAVQVCVCIAPVTVTGAS